MTTPKIPLRQYANTTENATTIDNCQTPPEAADWLIYYFKRAGVRTVWEPACGTEGFLVEAFRRAGFNVIASDIIYNYDFLKKSPQFKFDAIATNPPYVKAAEFMALCREYRRRWGIVWGLLLKIDRDGVDDFDEHLYEPHPDEPALKVSPIEMIIPERRINYFMPGKGWGKDGKGKSHFSTGWWTEGLDIGYSKVKVPYQQEVRRGENAPFRVNDIQRSFLDMVA